jgi:hypothetical protein
MSVSTDAILFYGWCIEEGTELPWDDEKYDGDIDEWWRAVNGYVPPFEPFDDDGGGYAEGFSEDDPRVDEYFEHRRAWDEDHPLPFELVCHCSNECTMYGIAVLGTNVTASRGYPKRVRRSHVSLTKRILRELDKTIVACVKHGVELKGPPKWWLCSYWG